MGQVEWDRRTARVVSLSGAPSDALIWQRQAATILTVACRVTFTLRAGELALAPSQEPLATAELPYPDGGSRGVYAPRDLVPLKPRADVLLVGSAFSPGQAPVRELVARLRIAEVDKTVHVTTDRRADANGAVHESGPFTVMPLVPERAPAGIDNPFGVDGRQLVTGGGRPLPNLAADGATVATFGPLGERWSSRARAAELAGFVVPPTFDGATLPPALDPAFFQAASREQQLAALPEDATIRLEGLHRHEGLLEARLPGIAPRAFAAGAGGGHPIPLRADTLWIDSSRALVTVTWRGQLRLEGVTPEVFVLLTPAAANATWEDVERVRAGAEPPLRVPERRRAPAALVGTREHVATAEDRLRAPLPFAVRPVPPAPPPPVPGIGLPFVRTDGAKATPIPIAPAADVDSTLELPDAPLAHPAPTLSPDAAPRPWRAPPSIAHREAADGPPPAIAGPRLEPDPRREVATAPRDPLRIVWFEQRGLSRARLDPRFAAILADLDDQPRDLELDDDGVESAEEPEDRREALELLARAERVTRSDLDEAIRRARSDDGRWFEPIEAVEGELRMQVDPVALLRGTFAAIAPFAPGDVETTATLTAVRALLESPGLPLARGAIDAWTATLSNLRRPQDGGAVDIGAEVTETLLKRRALTLRRVLGGEHALGRLHFGGTDVAVYVPREASARLPAAVRIRVRMLAMVHPRPDPSDRSSFALRPIALGVMPRLRAG